jgi:hypothetical protein
LKEDFFGCIVRMNICDEEIGELINFFQSVHFRVISR